MNKINLEKYLYQLLDLSTFYQYSRTLYEDTNLINVIKKKQYESLKKTVISTEKLNVDNQTFEDIYRPKLEGNVDNRIKNGIKILRQQIIVSSHTVFENYLCNVVRVYLNVFPEVLKNRDKSIKFREIVNPKDNGSILNYIIEKEVNDFNWLSLEEKKDYLIKRLKILNPKGLWEVDGEYLLKEIDDKRHSIIHDENPVEISEEDLFKYLY